MRVSGMAIATTCALGIIAFVLGFGLLFPGAAAWPGSALIAWELTLYGFGVAIAIVLSYQNWRNRQVK